MEEPVWWTAEQQEIRYLITIERCDMAQEKGVRVTLEADSSHHKAQIAWINKQCL